MAKNGNLCTARIIKNDEFYTQFTDVAAELEHYKPHFKDKIIYCNCDDPSKSAFWEYFYRNFKELGLKKLISTYYDRIQLTYKTVYTGSEIKTDLNGNGDFRSEECIKLLKEADIIITNPPFSLFREYIALLMQYDKTFLIIGSMNAVTYKEVFPLVKDNKIWFGNNSPKEFLMPDKSIKRFGNIFWYTDLDCPKRHEPLTLFRSYAKEPERYLKYDNYNAINVDKTADIPCDYNGIMGVPISFLDKYCPEQFEILMLANGNARTNYSQNVLSSVSYIPTLGDKGGLGLINGKRVYARVLIRRH